MNAELDLARNLEEVGASYHRLSRLHSKEALRYFTVENWVLKEA